MLSDRVHILSVLPQKLKITIMIMKGKRFLDASVAMKETNMIASQLVLEKTTRIIAHNCDSSFPNLITFLKALLAA